MSYYDSSYDDDECDDFDGMLNNAEAVLNADTSACQIKEEDKVSQPGFLSWIEQELYGISPASLLLSKFPDAVVVLHDYYLGLKK